MEKIDMRIPSNLIVEVNKILLKEEKRLRKLEEIPKEYFKAKIVGEWKDTSPYENFGKMQYPTIVEYDFYGETKMGMITRTYDGDEQYFLWDITQQFSRHNLEVQTDTINKIYVRFPFKVLEGIVIGKRK